MSALNHERIYAYRFQGVDLDAKAAVWHEISGFLFEALGKPDSVLDPAAGLCEFINSIPARERWALDLAESVRNHAAPGVHCQIGDLRTVELPKAKFQGTLLSNFLEHLATHEDVAHVLKRMYDTLAPGGRIAVMGPNFKYTMKEYFDCADHTLALTETSVAEHLYGAGFEIERIIPKFLPYSFRSRLPASAGLVKLYLRLPFAWRFLGKQFLVVARRPLGGKQ